MTTYFKKKFKQIRNYFAELMDVDVVHDSDDEDDDDDDEENKNDVQDDEFSEFSAILDGITHRFILIQEFECLNEPRNSASRHPPRFSIGGYNALIDPRLCSDSTLVEITVGNKLLFSIPSFRKFYAHV